MNTAVDRPTARSAQSAQHGVLTEQMSYAKALAPSDMLPEQYRNKPENVLWAISYGEMLGLHAMVVINGMHNMQGKPTASAAFIGMLVRRAGHRLDVYTRDDTKALTAVAELTRADAPDRTFAVEWTWRRAEDAKLTGKGTWKQFPEAMLKARAATEIARDNAADALFGILYTPEELGADNTDEDGMVTAESLHKSGRRSAAPQQSAPEPEQEMPREEAPSKAEETARIARETLERADTPEKIEKLHGWAAERVPSDHPVLVTIASARDQARNTSSEDDEPETSESAAEQMTTDEPDPELVAGDHDYGAVVAGIASASDFSAVLEAAEFNGGEHVAALGKAIKIRYGDQHAFYRQVKDAWTRAMEAATG